MLGSTKAALSLLEFFSILVPKTPLYSEESHEIWGLPPLLLRTDSMLSPVCALMTVPSYRVSGYFFALVEFLHMHALNGTLLNTHGGFSSDFQSSLCAIVSSLVIHPSIMVYLEFPGVSPKLWETTSHCLGFSCLHWSLEILSRY